MKCLVISDVEQHTHDEPRLIMDNNRRPPKALSLTTVGNYPVVEPSKDALKHVYYRVMKVLAINSINTGL
jgi:hypothetical protein